MYDDYYYYAETRNLQQKSYGSAHFPSQSPTPIKKGEIHVYEHPVCIIGKVPIVISRGPINKNKVGQPTVYEVIMSIDINNIIIYYNIIMMKLR